MSDKKLNPQDKLAERKRLTKAEKIISICEGLENWDQDTLVNMAKEWYATLLVKESIKTIDMLYSSHILTHKVMRELLR